MSTSKNATNETKKPARNEGGGARSGPPQFVQRRLSEAELDQAKAAAENLNDVGEIIAQFVDDGYKFSASHDKYGGGTQVFITPVSNQLVNFGHTLTARAPNLVGAVAVLCWKHYTLFSQVWPIDDAPQKGPDWG